MSEEIKINKNNKSITFINNEIAFSQFEVADEILDLITNLQTQLQQKDNIIKEAREELLKYENDMEANRYAPIRECLEILDKENKSD